MADFTSVELTVTITLNAVGCLGYTIELIVHAYVPLQYLTLC